MNTCCFSVFSVFDKLIQTQTHTKPRTSNHTDKQRKTEKYTHTHTGTNPYTHAHTRKQGQTLKHTHICIYIYIYE